MASHQALLRNIISMLALYRFSIRAASACVSRPAFHPSYASSNLIFRISCSTFAGFISPSSGNRTTGQIACYKTGQIKNSQHSVLCTVVEMLMSCYHCVMQKKTLIQTNPYLRTPELYRKALVTNVSSSTAIETGTAVASIAKTLNQESAPFKTPQRSAR